jgi:hypothetical protein
MSQLTEFEILLESPSLGPWHHPHYPIFLNQGAGDRNMTVAYRVLRSGTPVCTRTLGLHVVPVLRFGQTPNAVPEPVHGARGGLTRGPARKILEIIEHHVAATRSSIVVRPHADSLSEGGFESTVRLRLVLLNAAQDLVLGFCDSERFVIMTRALPSEHRMHTYLAQWGIPIHADDQTTRQILDQQNEGKKRRTAEPQPYRHDNEEVERPLTVQLQSGRSVLTLDGVRHALQLGSRLSLVAITGTSTAATVATAAATTAATPQTLPQSQTSSSSTTSAAPPPPLLAHARAVSSPALPPKRGQGQPSTASAASIARARASSSRLSAASSSSSSSYRPAGAASITTASSVSSLSLLPPRADDLLFSHDSGSSSSSTGRHAMVSFGGSSVSNGGGGTGSLMSPPIGLMPAGCWGQVSAMGGDGGAHGGSTSGGGITPRAPAIEAASPFCITIPTATSASAAFASHGGALAPTSTAASASSSFGSAAADFLCAALSQSAGGGGGHSTRLSKRRAMEMCGGRTPTYQDFAALVPHEHQTLFAGFAVGAALSASASSSGGCAESPFGALGVHAPPPFPLLSGGSSKTRHAASLSSSASSAGVAFGNTSPFPPIATSPACSWGFAMAAKHDKK